MLQYTLYILSSEYEKYMSMSCLIYADKDTKDKKETYEVACCLSRCSKGSYNSSFSLYSPIFGAIFVLKKLIIIQKAFK